MLRRAGILLVATALGTGAAIGLAACGEDREGEVTIETSGTGTVGTETVPTETVETVTEFETAPETESSGGTTAPDDGGATAPETESEDDGGATAP